MCRHSETSKKIGDFKNSCFKYVYKTIGLTATAAKKIYTGSGLQIMIL